jgi:hypothetical protein
MRLATAFALASIVGGAVIPAGQDAPYTLDALHRPFDRLLDLYVRDGFVYYGALKSDRDRLDAYVAALDSAAAREHLRGGRSRQMAFWINAYNAIVLRTVVDRFPIRGRSPAYPPDSIRQIPGAFERAIHRVGGRAVTLDALEKDILVPFGDARVLLALGRGAVGGGRLRSEAYDPERLEAQLDAVAAETPARRELVRVDPGSDEIVVSPLFSWREPALVASFAAAAPNWLRGRSPLERAIVSLVGPHLTRSEAVLVEQNTFRLRFGEFDWRLNDFGSRH